MKILNKLLFLFILSFYFCMGQNDSLTLQLGYFPHKTYIQTVTSSQMIEKQDSNIVESITNQMSLNSQYILTTAPPVNSFFSVTYKIFDELNPKFNNLEFKGTKNRKKMFQTKFYYQ